ncbi:hypothetical protein [Brasilonema sp. UFV-L1]|uniref:hypothetical protein n=1 Tax=Brasilonema sp. UFV-L1 TaxID=2234130 RepID=UPI00145EF0DB|nr:hypothetical protein [Brasilonema sp. UFV-L1]
MPLYPLRNIHPACKHRFVTLAILRQYLVIVENLENGNIEERIINDAQLEKCLYRHWLHHLQPSEVISQCRPKPGIRLSVWKLRQVRLTSERLSRIRIHN